MNTELIEKRLELLESKQQWLFENTELSRMLFEYGVTIEQDKAIQNLLQSYRETIEKGGSISSLKYESEILNIVKGTRIVADYHFAEYYLELSYKDNSWEDVFEAIYGESIKYKHLFKGKR